MGLIQKLGEIKKKNEGEKMKYQQFVQTIYEKEKLKNPEFTLPDTLKKIKEENLWVNYKQEENRQKEIFGDKIMTEEIESKEIIKKEVVKSKPLQPKEEVKKERKSILNYNPFTSIVEMNLRGNSSDEVIIAHLSSSLWDSREEISMLKTELIGLQKDNENLTHEVNKLKKKYEE